LKDGLLNESSRVPWVPIFQPNDVPYRPAIVAELARKDKRKSAQTHDFYGRDKFDTAIKPIAALRSFASHPNESYSDSNAWTFNRNNCVAIIEPDALSLVDTR